MLRSLTKTWGLAGLRAGNVVGDPVLIAALRRVQPPWSVSSPAAAVMAACCTDRAQRESRAAATDLASHRAHLVEVLTTVGLPPIAGSQAPFVLVDTSALGPVSIREDLAERGFAVRRGDTFPGLGPHWIRLVVRTPDVSDALGAALTDLCRSRHAS